MPHITHHTRSQSQHVPSSDNRNLPNAAPNVTLESNLNEPSSTVVFNLPITSYSGRMALTPLSPTHPITPTDTAFSGVHVPRYPSPPNSTRSGATGGGLDSGLHTPDGLLTALNLQALQTTLSKEHVLAALAIVDRYVCDHDGVEPEIMIAFQRLTGKLTQRGSFNTSDMDMDM